MRSYYSLNVILFIITYSTQLIRVSSFESLADVFDYQVCLWMYKLNEKLGRGGFGLVYKATHRKTKVNYAIKFLKCHGAASDFIQLWREVDVLSNFQSEYIVKHYHSFPLHTKQEIAIVMEFCSGGSLKNLVKERGRLSEKDAHTIFTQLVAGVEYFHKWQVIHWDLKLDNIVLSDKDSLRIKIVDFGISGIRNADKSNYGTLYYMAPETLRFHQTNADSPIDVWSMGIILYALLIGELPFWESRLEDMRRVTKEGVTFSEDIPLSPEVKKLIKDMLRYDPTDRITLGFITHTPWVTQSKISE